MRRVFLACMASMALPAFAQSGQELARETVSVIRSQEALLAAAVRQRDTRGGKADFKRFVQQPLDDLQTKWGALPRERRFEFMPCLSALQEFMNHANDSFKAGHIGQPSSLFRQSLPICQKAGG